MLRPSRGCNCLCSPQQLEFAGSRTRLNIRHIPSGPRRPRGQDGCLAGACLSPCLTWSGPLSAHSGGALGLGKTIPPYPSHCVLGYTSS